MRSSRYNYLVDDFPVKGQALVFNLLNKTSISLGKRQRELFISNRYHLMEEKILSRMRRYNFIHTDDFDEILYAKEYFIKNENLNRKSSLVLIHLTDVCNLACTYCYQRTGDMELKDNSASKEQISRWIEFLKKFALENELEKLEIVFIGGEPTLKLTEMFSIIGELSTHCRRYNIELQIMVETNATLLTEENIKLLAQNNVNMIHTTVLESIEIHDSMKITKRGEGTFAAVQKALTQLPEDIHIIVSLLTAKGAVVPKEMINSLSEMGLARRRGSTSLIIRNVTPAENDPIEKRNQFWDLEQIGSEIRSISYGIEKGFKMNWPEAMYLCRLGYHKFSFFMMYSGELYNCPVIDESVLSGNISDTSGARCKDADWQNCAECQYLPLCGGSGCSRW